MNDRNLVICDCEKRYALNLMEMLLQKKELDFRVRVCSSIEQAVRFSEEQSIDLLLIDDGYPYEERSQIRAKQVCLLSRGGSKDKGKAETVIYKYQSAEAIASALLQEGGQEALFCRKGKRRGKLVGVYSPVHRIGKTTFALQIGRRLAKKESVLYLNMDINNYLQFRHWEEYKWKNGGGPGTARQKGETLTDILYYAKQENSNMNLRLNVAAGHWDDLDYIMPVPVWEDIFAVGKEEWKNFLMKITEESIYETIILDIGDCIQGLLEVLELCSVIYMPETADRLAKEKIKQFWESLEYLGRERIKECIHSVDMEEETKKRVQKAVSILEEQKT